MAENNIKVEHNIDDTGRRVETRVYETVLDGKKERVVETHVEQIPLVLQERVVESIAPVVTSRKKETYKDGKVVDTVIEELDHGTMKMSAKKPQESALTRDDLLSVLREVLTVRDTVREVKPVKQLPAKKVVAPEPEPEPEPEVEEEEVPVQPVVKRKVVKVAAEPAPTPTPSNNKFWEFIEIGAYVILSGELAFCLYQLVLKNWL
jgi:hypothetical protein